jgi:APA family basic amino acid/polyamine antiporter
MPLLRTLRFGDLSLLIIGTVIGSGIFLVPAGVLRNVNGSVSLALGVWLAGGVLSLLGALSYGELSARNPEAGGLYLYIRDGFGPLPAFLYGWTLFFLISSGSVATLAVAFSAYLSQVIPLSPFGAKAVSVLMIACIAAINVRGTRQSADIQNYTTAVKLLGVLTIAMVLLLLDDRTATHAVVPSGQYSTLRHLQGFTAAMISVLWAYEGWQYCTLSAGETLNPQRNFPRAFLLGSAVLIAVYLLTNIAYIHALGPERAAQSESIAAAAIAATIGPRASKLVSLAILVSMFSAANGLTITSPRVYYAMSNDRLFFRSLARVHPKFHTPAFAVVAGSAWAALLAATGTFEQLLTYVVFSGWIFYGLAAASIFTYRKTYPDEIRPYSVPGYPFTPILFIAAAFALVANTVVAQPARALIGLMLIASGVPAFLIWRSRLRASERLATDAPEQSSE